MSFVYSGLTNRFENCRIRDASGTAMTFYVEGKNRTWTAAIYRCEFINCGIAIVGTAVSRPSGDALAGGAEFDPEIHNCVFDSVGWGCIFSVYTAGQDAPNPYVNPRITGNLFKQVQWSALNFQDQ